MKKNKLISLAMIGISIGFLTVGCQAKGEPMNNEMRSFYEQLRPDAQQKFMQLDTQHRRMAMGIMDQYCQTPQECKGHREQAVEEQYQHQMQQRQQMNQRQQY